ncbi:hypothetical protein G9A89_022020 [Geosiphon pyriformis]|nr:hypothetical protein G9A89_022020 [Geosiphon pyriformis]
MVLFLVGTHLSGGRDWTPMDSFPIVPDNVGPLSILGSGEFLSVCDCLSHVDIGCLSVYTDESLRNLGTVSCKAGTAVFFEDIGLSLGIGVSGLMLFILAELQAIALHIVNLIHGKNLRVSWHKVKDHSGVEGNKQADVIADSNSFSSWFLPPHLNEHFLMTNGVVISGNSRRFVRDVFHFISYARWEIGLGVKFLASDLASEIDWSRFLLVWHLDLHMATGFTSRVSVNACTYFMKTLHH